MFEGLYTKRPLQNILAGIKQVPGRPLRIASKEIAWRDLKRVGRNTKLVNIGEIN